jgi:heme exporter protein A
MNFRGCCLRPLRNPHVFRIHSGCSGAWRLPEKSSVSSIYNFSFKAERSNIMIHFKVKHLACIKGKQYLFRNLSFLLNSGDLLLVQGVNGSGKSSLLRILAGLASCERGTIENKSEIAYVGHLSGIKKGLTVLENIAIQLTLVKSFQAESEIDSVLKNFGLTHVSHRLCQRLSMGQQRKVALAALVLKQKPVWILDEPFTALDKTTIEVLSGYMRSHLATGGIIIVASHSVEGIEANQQIELASC